MPSKTLTSAPGTANNIMANNVNISVSNELADEIGMFESTINRIEENSRTVIQNRKDQGRIVSKNLTNLTSIKSFKKLTSYKYIHNAKIPGILSLDIHGKDCNKILTGGNDKNAIIFNKALNKKTVILEGHTQKVTQVVYHPEEDVVITGSLDATIRVWYVGNAIPLAQVIRAHKGSVTCVTLHPTGDYVLSTSTDQYWAFSDINTGELLTRVSTRASNKALTAGHVHPDGLVFGTGTSDSKIMIWDIKNQAIIGTLSGHLGPIAAISFSGNGYYLATSANDCCVKLWDLRKLQVFKTLYIDDGYKINNLCFDKSGTYLGIAGSDVRVFHGRMHWQQLKVFKDHTSMATGIQFGKDSQFIASSSVDGTLNLYGI